MRIRSWLNLVPPILAASATTLAYVLALLTPKGAGMRAYQSLLVNMTNVIMQTYVHARIPCTDMHATYMHTHISAYAYFDVPDGAYV